jgi:peptidase inhibitor family I36
MIKKLLVTSVLVGTGLFASGMSASAGSNLCPADRACIYDHNNWVALLGTKGPGQGLSNVSGPANDKTDSWENKTTRNGAWYHDVNGQGDCHTMGPGKENPNLSVGPSDELSSWKTSAPC